MSRALSQRDFEQLANFRYEIRRFLHFSEEGARAAGIDPQQHQLLLTIKARGAGEGVPISEIAERLQVRHHSAVELVDRAGGHGLVQREPSPADRRQVLVRLTEKGEAILRGLSASNLAELRQRAPALVAVLADLVPEAAGAGDRR